MSRDLTALREVSAQYKISALLFLSFMRNFCLWYFFSFRKVKMASIICRVQLKVVITYMCTHKAVGSNRSFVTGFRCQQFCNLVYIAIVHTWCFWSEDCNKRSTKVLYANCCHRNYSIIYHIYKKKTIRTVKELSCSSWNSKRKWTKKFGISPFVIRCNRLHPCMFVCLFLCFVCFILVFSNHVKYNILLFMWHLPRKKQETTTASLRNADKNIG